MSPSVTKKKAYLEGLRGFAAVVVVIHHYSLAFYPKIVFGLSGLPTHSPLESWFSNSPLYLLVDGNFAVSVFFALSGYVLTLKLIRSPNLMTTCRSLFKRYFRLAPMVFVAVIVSYPLLTLGLFYAAPASEVTGSQLWLGQLWNFQPSLATAVSVGTYGAFAHISDYITVLWSMHYEFLGSILCIVLASLSRSRGFRLAGYAIASVFLWHGYFFGMILGTVVAETHVWFSGSQWRERIKKEGLLGPLIMFAGLYLGMFPQFGQPRGMFIPLAPLRSIGVVATHSIGASLVLVGILLSHRAQSALGGKVGTVLGRISFPLYLLHTLVLASFACWYFDATQGVLGYNWAAISAFLFSVPIIVVGAALATRFVDVRSVTFANYLAFRVFPARRKATTHLSDSTQTTLAQ